MSRFLKFAVAIALALPGTSLVAQTWPTKPVRIVVPFPPGQGADTLMRMLAEKLAGSLEQPFIVENKPGAGGMIGTDFVARQPSDGYTLLMGASGPLGIAPGLQPKVPYDSVKDFEPIAAIASVAQVFMVNPQFRADSISSLVSAAKAKPGEIAYASSGNGTTQHLMVEKFAAQAGISLLHVPYKGSAPAMTDLIGGQVALASDTIPAALPHIKAGKVRPLAVTSAARSPNLPDVPTLDESGIKGYRAVGWIGVLAPAGTPAGIAERLDGEIRKAMADPAFQSRMKDFGFDTMTESREAFRAFIASEVTAWRKVVTDAGVKAD